MARLPCIDSETGRFENFGALVIGKAEPEPTGDDRALVVLEAEIEISRARLHELLKSAGLDGDILATKRLGGAEDLWLVEIRGFVGPGDPRLANLVALANKTVRRAIALGAYAAPIRLG